MLLLLIMMMDIITITAIIVNATIQLVMGLRRRRVLVVGAAVHDSLLVLLAHTGQKRSGGGGPGPEGGRVWDGTAGPAARIVWMMSVLSQTIGIGDGVLVGWSLYRHQVARLAIEGVCHCIWLGWFGSWGWKSWLCDQIKEQARRASSLSQRLRLDLGLVD